MSFSIGKAFTSFIKPALQGALRAVSPQVTDALQKLAGTAFDGIGKGLKGLIAGALPGPIGILASKLLGGLIDKGTGALKNLGQDAIAKLVEKLAGQATTKTTSDGVTVTTPPLIDRGTPAATSSSSSAVTAAINEAHGLDTTDTVGAGSFEARLISKFPSEPDINSVNFEDPKQAAAFQLKMQRYNQASQAITNLLQMMHEGKKSIIQNFRG